MSVLFLADFANHFTCKDTREATSCLYLYFVYSTGLSVKPNVDREVTTTLAALVMLSGPEAAEK